jgi:ABC-type Zn2+ transport system substrate-binding protein/surface adhesin
VAVARNRFEQESIDEGEQLSDRYHERQSHKQKKIPSTRMGNAVALRVALVEARNYAEKWHRYEQNLAEYEAKVEGGNQDVKRPDPPERDLKLEALGKVLR